MRYIGIRHRVKQSAEGEALPTQVAIIEPGKKKPALIALDDEQAELDFLRGIYPVKYRSVDLEETLDPFLPHHIKWREKKDDAPYPEHLMKKEGRKTFIATQVPAEYDGLKNSDIVSMVLGGSGDYFALGLATRAKDLQDAVVRRIPPAALSYYRNRRFFEEAHPAEAKEFDALMHTPEKARSTEGTERLAALNEMFEKVGVLPKSKDKENDALLLAWLAEHKGHRFYDVMEDDESVIWVRECYRKRIESMKARIACEQRLRQFSLGEMFRKKELWKNGIVEESFNEVVANDAVFQNLKKAEANANADLERALKQVAFYNHLMKLDECKGVGPAIAARIFSAVIDIRRFPRESGFVAFAGMHVLPDGRFPRKRGGEVANWQSDLRQALYLLGDQFVKRPDSVWGKRLNENKAKFLEKHPETIVVAGKKKYNPGHIHKMATWRTLTQFTRWLYKEWVRFEGARAVKGKDVSPEQKAA